MAERSTLDNALRKKALDALRSASPTERQEALKHATEFIDTLPFKGERLTEHQALAWPRQGVFRDDGAPISGVPDEIKQATRLVAGFVLAKLPFDAPGMAWVMFLIGHLLEDDVDLLERHVTWH